MDHSVSLERRLSEALQLAREAGDMARRLRPAPGAPAATLKGDQDWVTEADGAVEAFIAARLAEAFPEDGFQGEETGRTRAGALRWVVDPIDGTANYARGGARWCVSLGLLEGATPLLGVLAAPAAGEVFAARLGGGATLNDMPIRAATTTALARATVECGWSPSVADANYLELIRRTRGAGAAIRSGGSGALGLADVACGRTDGFMELHINLWDVAGALPVLAEAGAFVSAFAGDARAERGGPILAAAPGLADALRAAADFIDWS